MLATAIIDIAGLGFLRLGPPDPRTPEWGTMLTDARRFLATAPWLVFFPASPSSSARSGSTCWATACRESLDRGSSDDRHARRAAGRPTGRRDVLLDVSDLVVQFRTHDGTIHAVNGISFQLARGERLGLVGESGCGKSVTNLAIIRLLPNPAGQIERGSVLFDGVDLVTMDEADVREIRGRDIAMIFQDPMTSLNPVLTVEEQMTETIVAHRKMSKADARARAAELLSMVGIPQPEARLKSFPHQFSGGMRQRVMIAMAWPSSRS